ncbi:uncharacterized protein LOC123294190 [Chrysoperla carnea]|uniref:uncharacterized protein LOC123294190 n=1 Tax=Chrysoperla carnea TaxID=189513 RepID=UPI001D07F989|nr:uncharacterized protein LOC123294190 [Chrysoperla carnea]
MDEDPINVDNKMLLDDSSNIIIGAETMEYRSWDYGSTLILIQLYKRYYDKLGSYNVKSLKKMWEIISQCFIKEYNLNYSPKHCENRWRVLERSFRKYNDVNRQSGRKRRHFEYAAEMESLLKNKKYAASSSLMGTSMESQLRDDDVLLDDSNSSSSTTNLNENLRIGRNIMGASTSVASKQMLFKNRLKKSSLEALRIQFKNYHSQKLDLK